jgi:acetyl-CoA acyltransferase
MSQKWSGPWYGAVRRWSERKLLNQRRLVLSGMHGHAVKQVKWYLPISLSATSTLPLVTSAEFAKRHGLDVLARIRSTAVAGVEPEYMGMGPVPATRKALARAGLRVADLDVVEINEAFGSQAIACLRELDIDRDRVNLDGGAISIGHPLGATGARITAKAAQVLRREGKRYALATQCIGGGQGIATILEAA